jgi:Tfp pilus assembly protein FimT
MRILSDKKGFSLLEITVIMAIFVTMMIIGSDFVIQGLKSTTFGYEQDEAIQNSRRALNTMTEEIREAAPAANGDYLFNTVGTSTLIFYSNVDSDSYTEKIRYFVVGTYLHRGVTKATGSPLSYPAGNETVTMVAKYLNNVTIPIFTYFDTDNDLIASASSSIAQIRLIHVSLKVNVTPDRAPNDYFVETDTQIRNLKDNL